MLKQSILKEKEILYPSILSQTSVLLRGFDVCDSTVYIFCDFILHVKACSFESKEIGQEKCKVIMEMSRCG